MNEETNRTIQERALTNRSIRNSNNVGKRERRIGSEKRARMFDLFRKKKEDKQEKEYVICPNCGAGYNTDMIAMSIFSRSPFMEDLSYWSTRVVCRNCRAEFGVSGSYRKVFGQRKPS